jgi:hypothetical protein
LSDTQSPQELWNELTGWLEYWYHEPDIEALKISLCAAVTHYYPQEKPLWLLIIGDSGSGKTEIAMQSLRLLPDARVVGRVTPSCFLSSREKGGKQNSLLYRGGHSQIWLFKDFTTFGSMRFEARAEVAAQLREIWDGENSSDTGSGDTLHWVGKVTTIAAATPEFEEFWAALRNLGDRFTTVRWREPENALPAMQKGRDQAGNEEEIRAKTQELIHLLWRDKQSQAKMPSGPLMDRIDMLASVVAQLRVFVSRESDNGRSILRIPKPEFPTRLSMAFSQVIRTHMDIMHKSKPDEEDFSLARRLAMDTIPPPRRRILECVPHNEAVSYGSLLYTTKLPRTSLQRQLEELVCLGVLDETVIDNDWSTRSACLSAYFRSRLDSAKVKFRPGAGLSVLPKKRRKASLNPDYAVEN